MVAEEEQEKDVEETEEVNAEAEPIKEAEPTEEIEEEIEQGEIQKEETPEETAEAEKEEVKPPREKKAEEEIVEERVYTIPLGRAWIMPPNKRAPRAMRIVKSFITKHMKLERREEEEEEAEETGKLVISNEVNEKVWSRSIEKPPRKIRVRAAKDKGGVVTVYLAEGD